jgi:hypothetical protein
MASDESLFAIEDKELAGEGGVVALPTSGAAADGSGVKGKVGGKPATPAAPAGAAVPRATALSVGVALTEHLCLLETACSR